MVSTNLDKIKGRGPFNGLINSATCGILGSEIVVNLAAILFNLSEWPIFH